MTTSIKALILAGIRTTRPVDCPELAVDGFDGTLTVRAITEAEEAEAEAAAMAGQTVRGQPGRRPTDQEIDVAASARGQRESSRIRVAYGLSVDGEKWTPAEVGKLPTAVVRRLDRTVQELSGSTPEQQERAASFRLVDRGEGPGDPASDGLPAGDLPS